MLMKYKKDIVTFFQEIMNTLKIKGETTNMYIFRFM